MWALVNCIEGEHKAQITFSNAEARSSKVVDVRENLASVRKDFPQQ
jgi:hypothetical protein